MLKRRQGARGRAGRAPRPRRPHRRPAGVRPRADAGAARGVKWLIEEQRELQTAGNEVLAAALQRMAGAGAAGAAARAGRRGRGRGGRGRVKARKIDGLDPDGALADNAERIVRVRLDELCGFMPRAADPAEWVALHDMRIAAKRLRYVLEVTGEVLRPLRDGRDQARQGPPGPAGRDPRLRRPDPRHRGLGLAAARGRRRCARRAGRRRRRPRPGAAQAGAAPPRPHGRRRARGPPPRPPPRPLRPVPGAVGRARAQGVPCTTRIRHRRADGVGSGIDVTDLEQPTPEAPPVDLEQPSLYFNRELSWLDFNDRVLQLAEDPRVPLLERMKFCRDLLEQPRRVLHGPRGRDARVRRRRDRPPARGRPHAGRDRRGHRGARPRPDAPAVRAASTTTCGPRSPSTASASSTASRSTPSTARSSTSASGARSSRC